jgi:hypothetical protein
MSTLFFKSPPQISLTEMCADLPRTEEAFEASNCFEYSQSAAAWSTFGRKTESLKGLMSFLLGEDWPGRDAPGLAFVQTEQLMILIFCLSFEYPVDVCSHANHQQASTRSFLCLALA